MGFCLARRRGQEKIEDGFEKVQEGGGNGGGGDDREGTNGQSECRVRGGLRDGVRSWYRIEK